MPAFTPEKALRDFPKTPAILNTILHGVDQQHAQQATDGSDGWSVLEVVCHMNDFEQIFLDRARQTLASDLPKFVSVDPDLLAKTHHYTEQRLADVFASYVSRRREFLSLARSLTPEEWQRKGIHPASGEMTLVEQVTNTTLHDVNHIEQIIKALGTSLDLPTL